MVVVEAVVVVTVQDTTVAAVAFGVGGSAVEELR